MKIPPKKNKIARISVRDIPTIDLIKTKFLMKFWILLWVAMFDLGLQKNLAAKFWILPGKCMNLAARYRAITYKE